MIPKTKNIFLAAIVLTLLAGGTTCFAQEGPTALEIVDSIYQKVMDWDFKTMSYDEIRVISYELQQGGGKTTMPMSAENGSTLKLRYFYQTPDKHGYKMLSEPVNDYWIGSPNQPGAIPMDHKWKDKVTQWYDLSRAEKTREYKGRKCYLVTLMPIDGKPAAYPMTWYVDAENFVVLKFEFLLDMGTTKIRAVGDVTYDDIQGHLLPSRAEWRTRMTGLPYIFVSTSDYANYNFNMPLDASVFLEEFPKDWFTKLGEDPYRNQQ